MQFADLHSMCFCIYHLSLLLSFFFFSLICSDNRWLNCICHLYFLKTGNILSSTKKSRSNDLWKSDSLSIFFLTPLFFLEKNMQSKTLYIYQQVWEDREWQHGESQVKLHEMYILTGKTTHRMRFLILN